MKSSATAWLLAIAASGLWLFAYVKHEYTFLRVPWVGITLTAAALAFVAVGLLGRGWRALLAATVTSVAATFLLAVIFWVDDDAPVQSACDPGCIPISASATFAAAGAIILVASGIALRRLAAGVGRR